MARPLKPPAPPAVAFVPGSLPAAVGEEVWIDVIRKMDEVYSDLLQYEVALEQKNAALEESQQFIYSVLTAMSDILVVCDRHARIQQVNQALVELTGRSEAELRDRELKELFADAESCERAERHLRELPRERVQECEVQLRTRDGGSTLVAVSCTPRVASSGRYLGVVLTGRPIGELRRAYDALRQAHDELKHAQQQLVHSEKMASLGRLVAGVAHELNNPISFVLGNAYALQRYSQRIGKYLEAVHAGATGEPLAALRRELRIDRLLEDLPPLIDGTIEGAERTRDIVTGLKRFSAPDQGEQVVFDLGEVVARSLHWVVRASGTRIALDVQVPPRLMVRGSPGQMQQVLVNLVQNAIDSTEQRSGPLLQVRGRADGDGVELEFLDNGPGFRESALSQVFDPFYTTKPVGKGTGLGLSISYSIVERHGGRLTATNRPEGGACLRLWLPRVTGQEDSGRPA